MRIRDYRTRHTVDVTGDKVCSLPTDTLQGRQLLNGRRNFAIKSVKDLVRHDDQVSRLRAEEARGTDEFLDILDVRFGHGLRRRVFREQCRGHEVHPSVCALGRQTHRDQQLVRVLVGEGTEVVRELCFQ